MKRLPVEPLSEERWQQVEHGVFRSLDARPRAADPVRRRGPWLGGAIALGFVAALVLARVVTNEPAAVAPGSRAFATAAQPDSFAFADVHIEAAPHTNVTLVAGPSARKARLHTGEAQFVVPSGVALELAVGPVLVRATSVRFVASYSSERAAVRVEDGELTVVDGDRALVLRRAERWPTPAQPKAAIESVPKAEPSPESLPDQRNSEPAESSRPARGTQEARYERAARVEGTQPELASALYRELAQERGGWAENALFALGRLQLERGRQAAGHATLAAYLTRYPRGRNAGDAQRLLGSQD